VVYVDETDDKALQTSLQQAGRAYRGLFPLTTHDAELQDIQNKHAAFFEARGEPGAAEIVRHLVDPDYLLSHDLILLGSPATVVKKLKAWATSGVFNTFFGEFNFGDLAEEDLMRSIRLFGTEVIPHLRDFEPF
jgi:alkanesulfonate monooxygenase SsuD/methylene tetrahydromethanopterin reductase-like flavin-dependent oxidoreductase (luciferase family)